MADDSTDTSEAPAMQSRGSSVWSLLTVVAGALALVEVVGPLNDPDIWWHVRTGQLILDTGHVPHHEPWAFTALGRVWVPNAWLSDLVLGISYRWGGWTLVTLVFLAASAAVLWLLGRGLHREHSGPVAFSVFVLTTGSILIFLAERPQVASLAFCVWLVGVCRKLMRAEAINPWGFLALVYLWANLHGMWVLAPMALALAYLGALVSDHAAAWRLRRSVAAMVLGSFVVAALTPVGPRLAYWGLVVRKSAAGVSEWQPTTLWNHQAAWFVALALLTIGNWAFARERPSRTEGIWVLGVLALALSAGRNLAPASIFIAPFAADALQRTIGAERSRRAWPRVPTWTLPLSAALIGSGLVTVVLATPRLPSDTPRATVAALKVRPESPVRVLNDFNLGGFLTGMGAPKISVTIDGRIDNYDIAFINSYWALSKDGDGLDAFLSRYHPDVAVLADGSVLRPELEARGWRIVLRDHGWVTLEPPSE